MLQYVIFSVHVPLVTNNCAVQQKEKVEEPLIQQQLENVVGEY